MRSRHRIVEIESDRSAEPTWIKQPNIKQPSIKQPNIKQPGLGSWQVDDVELIDETTAPRPAFPVLPRATGQKQPQRDRPSAVPGERPGAVRPSLPWGLGTDGWPRHNSRLVRLFACEPSAFVDGVAGRTWQSLQLAEHVCVATDGGPASGGWPVVVAGELMMPYLSPPLAIELRCQPFHGRSTRVDIVVVSHCRWPRRFFDVASRCLTEMQQLERPMECVSPG